MDSHVLVAAQISSLFPPTSATTVVVNTKQKDVPLLPNSESEHASFADIFYHELSGTILLRVIHDGQVLELVSLSTDAPAIRFIFPATILPNPAILWGPSGLHVIAVTSIGSVYRLIIPLSDGMPLWQATPLSAIRIREYEIRGPRGNLDTALAHVQGLYCVAVGFEDGSLLRLDADDVGEESQGGEVLTLSPFVSDFQVNRIVARKYNSARWYYQRRPVSMELCPDPSPQSGLDGFTPSAH